MVSKTKWLAELEIGTEIACRWRTGSRGVSLHVTGLFPVEGAGMLFIYIS